jgi:hypothetical protein
MTEEEFLILFPDEGQDIEFIEDTVERVGDEELERVMSNVGKRPVEKPDVVGIHGTVFYELLWKKRFYPTKKNSEMVFARPTALGAVAPGRVESGRAPA